MNTVGSHSLRRRLSHWLAFQVLLSFALVSLAVYLVIANHLVTRQTNGLQEKQEMIQHLVAESTLDSGPSALWHEFDNFLAGHEELQVVVSDAEGTVVYKGVDAFVGDNQAKSVTFEVPAYGGSSTPGTVVLSINRHADQELLRWLAFALVIASLLATVAVVRGVYWKVKLELRSVDSLVDQIDQLTASTLETRLEGSSLPSELQPLVRQFNDLLERLSGSYTQLENFNADVAHELNTPLTTLITSSELALRQASNGSVDSSVVGSNLEELQRMSEIIRSMMFLSKAERGSQARCEAVSSIAAVVQEVIDYHEASLSESDLEVAVKGDSKGEFDVPLLKRGLSNLLGNAGQYATPRSTIIVTIASVDKERVSISVTNSGETIRPEQLALIFNRFYRSDQSRSLSDKHHGLGLSIVAAIARMHGGRTFAHSDNGQTSIGFTLARQQQPHTAQVSQ